jgi:hypothetical protein
MPLVAGHQIIGARGVGTFQKFVVVRVARHLELARGRDGMRVTLNELEELLAEALADVHLRAREHFPVLGHNRLTDVEPGRFGDCKQQDGALKSVRFEGCRNNNVVSITSRSAIIGAWAWQRAPP